MPAAGKVTIGYSLPYVAKYHDNGDGTTSYSDGQQLARGVSVNVSPESSDNNNFFANNIIAENDAGTFTGGQATLTVDGLLQEAEQMIQGLQAADADGFINYDDDQQAPYLGVGFIIKSRSDNVDYYTPVILTKTVCSQIETAAETQGEEIDWQTQDLVFNIYKDDSTKRRWKRVGGELTSEALAEAAIKNVFGIVDPEPEPEPPESESESESLSMSESESASESEIDSLSEG